MQLSSRAFAQQEQDPGFTNATGGKDPEKKTDLSLTSRHQGSSRSKIIVFKALYWFHY